MRRAALKISVNAIIATVLALLFIIVTINLMLTISERGENALEDAPCAQSVQQQARLNANLRLYSSGLKCPTRLVELPRAQKEETKTILAQQLLKCWNTFGKGTLELFSEDEAVYCHACSHIIVQPGVTITSKEFLKHLETPIPSTLPEYQGKTYAQALYPHVQDEEKYFNEEELNAIPETATVIDGTANQDYAVIFRYAKGKDAIKDLLTKTEAAAPGVALSMTGIGVIAIGAKVLGFAVLATPPVAIVTGIAVVATIAGGVIAYILGSYVRQPPSWMADVHIRPYNKETLATLGCEVVETSSEES